jgi:hypothetical protein
LHGLGGVIRFLLVFHLSSIHSDENTDKEQIMENLAKIKQEWEPLSTDSLYEIPTERPVICMEHKQTKDRAYFDVKLDRLLSPQEAFDVMRGYNFMA